MRACVGSLEGACVRTCLPSALAFPLSLGVCHRAAVQPPCFAPPLSAAAQLLRGPELGALVPDL